MSARHRPLQYRSLCHCVPSTTHQIPLVALGQHLAQTALHSICKTPQLSNHISCIYIYACKYTIYIICIRQDCSYCRLEAIGNPPAEACQSATIHRSFQSHTYDDYMGTAQVKYWRAETENSSSQRPSKRKQMFGA